MRLAALLLLAACSGAPQPAESPPERVIERRLSDTPAPRGAALLERAMLSGHNEARAALGLAPLRWNAALAADARRYADELARTGRFAHSPQPRGDPPQGENLWTGTRGAYSYPEMIGHWVAERRFYRPLPVPDSSVSGRFGDVGHYSQIVWRATQEVGCAEARNRRDDYLVCRYLPAGNIVGETAY
ncbi:MAG TPA: CAP domain-containing protein [Allosphingosinicella sp.]|nr:CAP domain-containing protein [Allosphingosinicella sp.]